MNTLLSSIEIVRPEAIEFGPGAVATVGRWAKEKAFGAFWSSPTPSMRHAWRSSACPMM